MTARQTSRSTSSCELRPTRRITRVARVQWATVTIRRALLTVNCAQIIQSPTALADETKKVHGLDSLRVGDASAMPSIVSGNLNAAVVMMAERAADLIAGRVPLADENAPVWMPADRTSNKTFTDN